MKTNTKNIFIAAMILIVVVIGVFVLASYLTQPKEMDSTTFFQHLQAQNIEKLEINNATATFKLKDNDNTTYRVYIREERLNEVLSGIPLEKQPKISYNDPYAGNAWNYVFYVIMIIGAVFLFFMLFRNIGAADRKAVSVGRAGVNAQQAQKVRFNDIAGAEEEKQELSEIVEFLKSPQKFAAAGARIPRGVLLVGPPGTGKTLFAKAVSGEAKVPFFSISGSDFVELYVGVGASRVRDLFDIAKRHKPCIVFIDEIDAVGRRRGSGMGGGHDEREQTLNQLLVQMDGFEPHDDIIILAATNRSDILDPALMRPGRFDRQIQVHAPDVRGREEIFKVHSRNKQIDSSVDFKVLARITSGFTGADIANLLNEAAILAARADRTLINMADISEAINKVTLGPQKKSRVVSEFDKRVTAYHEAGHTIVARSIPECDPVYEVSIIPRGDKGGYTAFRQDDDAFKTTNELKAYLAMTMGGRAAEELVIKDFSIGAQGDIKQATALTRHMVTEWGMSTLGPIYYGQERELFLGRDYGATHSYSESVAGKIDAEVESIITAAHKRAVDVLSASRDKLDTMARVLIECETIFADEVDMIMQGKPAAEVLQHIKQKFEKKEDVH